MRTTHDLVRDQYGRHLQGTADLKTTAWCDASATPDWLRPLLARLHPAVLGRYCGCGLVCPPRLQGCRVLDLGCGAGRDVHAPAQLVGPQGEVVGVDTTDEQLQVAQAHRAPRAGGPRGPTRTTMRATPCAWRTPHHARHRRRHRPL